MRSVQRHECLTWPPARAGTAVGMVVVTAAGTAVVGTADMADMGMGGMGTEEAISTIVAAAST